jgi:hypothetical protein
LESVTAFPVQQHGQLVSITHHRGKAIYSSSNLARDLPDSGWWNFIVLCPSGPESVVRPEDDLSKLHWAWQLLRQELRPGLTENAGIHS